MKAFSYLFLQFKRIKTLFKNAVIVSLCFSLFILITAWAVTKKSNLTQGKYRFSVGVVGSNSNIFLKLGMSFLKTMDDTRYVLDIQEYKDEKEAEKNLEEGKISGYAVIPPEFFDSLYYFKNNSSIEVHVKSGLKGITGVVMEEVGNLASNIIIHTEAGLFTLMDFMEKNRVSYREQNYHVDNLFETYLKVLVRRSSISEVKELGSNTGLSFTAYYICAFLLLYSFLLTFVSLEYQTKSPLAFKKMVFVNGTGAFKQVLSEIIAVFVLNLVLYFIFVLFILIFFALGLFNIEEFGAHQAREFFVFTIKLIPALFLFTLAGFFIFEAVSGTIPKVMTAFVLIFGGAYVSGYFYPKNFLPLGMRAFGDALPTGVSFSYAVKVINGEGVFTAGKGFLENACGWFIVLYSVLFLLLTVGVRYSRLKGRQR